MASFNKIILVGYLGRDPEIRYTPQGQAVCNFSIATTEKKKDAGGDSQDVTTWFRVTVWGRLAEVANQYLSKGKQVYVEGRLRLNEYTDREGARRTNLEVNANELQFLSSSRGEGDGRYEGGSATGTGTPAQSEEPTDYAGPTDSDIPF